MTRTSRLDTPLRNLVRIIVGLLVIVTCATAAYVAARWGAVRSRTRAGRNQQAQAAHHHRWSWSHWRDAGQVAGRWRRALATVLPNDSANVFITLSARSINPHVEIIVRGEVPSTEAKLIQAGANTVVLPTHIGAERIAEMILFPETARLLRTSERMRERERTLRGLGMETTVVVIPENGALANLSVAEIEERGRGGFLILQLNRRDGAAITAPERSLNVAAGDGVVIVGRNGRAVRTMFEAHAERTRVRRTTLQPHAFVAAECTRAGAGRRMASHFGAS